MSRAGLSLNPLRMAAAAPLPSKPHYMILDGLRGVASVMVVVFHLFEALSTSPLDQVMNHGYLAVDFFFLLSGFVVGYAYDDRWTTMSTGGFFKRRLIRLQPMVIMGMLVGAACFYFQDSTLWPHIHQVPVWYMLVIMLIGMTLLPIPPSMDIRGWQEMHPLDGPGWSLFFEYVANFLYGITIRKWPKKALAALVAVAALALIYQATCSAQGDLIGGWSLNAAGLRVGMARLMYPFFAGLLLFRSGKLARIPRAFFWCSLILLAVFWVPRIGGDAHRWENGLFEALSIILVFPLVVYLGASGEIKGKRANRFCRFLGDISYPLYITHYPFIYIYTGWVADHHVHLAQAYPVMLLVLAASLLLAYGSLKLYDEPLRAWLRRRFQ